MRTGAAETNLALTSWDFFRAKSCFRFAKFLRSECIRSGRLGFILGFGATRTLPADGLGLGLGFALGFTLGLILGFGLNLTKGGGGGSGVKESGSGGTGNRVGAGGGCSTFGGLSGSGLDGSGLDGSGLMTSSKRTKSTITGEFAAGKGLKSAGTPK